MNNELKFHLPTKPYSVIDSINRMALATGSTRNASAGSGANYNGHAYHVHTTIHGYGVSYTWCGLNWVARGCNARSAIIAGVRSYENGGLGSSLRVSLRPEDAGLAAEFGLVAGEEDLSKAEWFTWKHGMASEVLNDEKRYGGLPGVKLLLDAETKDGYRASVLAFVSERRNARAVAS